MKKQIITAFLLFFGMQAAQAVPVSFFDSVAAGTSQFDNTVINVGGGTVTTDTLSGLSSGNMWNRTGYSIASTNGSNRGITAAGFRGMSGQSININPRTPANQSGVTFTFNSAINAIGFEVGDWATCCFPSALYISFDGGAVQQVAVANNAGDNPTEFGFGGSVFIGAIDDTSTFTSATFYGDGFGEFLTIGGTIRYGTVGINSIPTPEPSTLILLGLGLAGIGFVRRRS